MMKHNVKLTSVNLIEDVYAEFKKNIVSSDLTLQKVVNRTLDLYNSDEDFRRKIDGHNTSKIKNSKY